MLTTSLRTNYIQFFKYYNHNVFTDFVYVEYVHVHSVIVSNYVLYMCMYIFLCAYEMRNSHVFVFLK